MYRKRLLWALLVLFAVVPVGLGLAWSNRNAHSASTVLLSAEDIRLARELAERDLDIAKHPSHPAEQTLFIKVDYLPGSFADSDQRLVIVQHYRYQGDETVFTLIDLSRQEVIRREGTVHFPTALNSAETRRAKKLAQNDERLKTLIAARRLQLEARPFQVTADDPRLGHRLAMILFRENADYLESPEVIVDLHTETVQVVSNP